MPGKSPTRGLIIAAAAVVAAAAVTLIVLWLTNVLVPRFSCNASTSVCSGDVFHGTFSGKNAKQQCLASTCALGGGGGAAAGKTYDCRGGTCVLNAAGTGAFKNATCNGGCLYCDKTTVGKCINAPDNQTHASDVTPRTSCDGCTLTYSCRRVVGDATQSTCTAVAPGDGQFATSTCGAGCYGCGGNTNKCSPVADNDAINGLYPTCSGAIPDTCNVNNKFACDASSKGCVPMVNGPYWNVSQCVAAGCKAPPNMPTQQALTTDPLTTVTPLKTNGQAGANALVNIGTFVMPPGCKVATLDVSVGVQVPKRSGTDFVWASIVVFQADNLKNSIDRESFITASMITNKTDAAMDAVASTPGMYVQMNDVSNACTLIRAMQNAGVEMQLWQPTCNSTNTSQTNGHSQSWSQPTGSHSNASILETNDGPTQLSLTNSVLRRPLDSPTSTPRAYSVFVYLTISTNDLINITPATTSNMVRFTPAVTA
jgi:hypothetical protein